MYSRMTNAAAVKTPSTGQSTFREIHIQILVEGWIRQSLPLSCLSPSSRLTSALSTRTQVFLKMWIFVMPLSPS